VALNSDFRMIFLARAMAWGGMFGGVKIARRGDFFCYTAGAPVAQMDRDSASNVKI
jgi:hypothetical protein